MKVRSVLLACIGTLVVLGGCTTGCGVVPGGCGPGPMGPGGGSGHGPAAGPAAGMGTDMGAGMGMGTGMGMGMGMGMGGDPAQACAMHRQLTEGRSPEEQREAIDARIQSMHGGHLTPEQLRMRREAMQRDCAGAPAGR